MVFKIICGAFKRYVSVSKVFVAIADNIGEPEKEIEQVEWYNEQIELLP